jgi:cytochrome bd ubiquinol oxidase subunit I
MEQQAFLLDLLRIKFGFMACFHYIFVPLTLGLIVSSACMESAYVWTRDAAWRLAAHFWFRLFVVGWVLGIVTGYPLRAQLAADWGNYFAFIKPVFDQVLPIESALGPIMLTGVAVLAVFGQRLFAATRMLLLWGLALAMFCQSATILSVNAWMQHPTGAFPGGQFFHGPSLVELLTNPMALSKIGHVFSAALVCGSTLICVVAGTYLYRRQHVPVAQVSLRFGIPLGLLAAVLVIVSGHISADHIARYQPMKFAAVEGLWQHEPGPAGLILFAQPQLASQMNRTEIKIPYAMSLLAGYGLSGSPLGIRDEVSQQEGLIREALSDVSSRGPGSSPLDGYLELYHREQTRSGPATPAAEIIHRAAMRTVPNVPILFGGFRVMVFVSVCLLALYAAALVLRQGVLAGRYRNLLLFLPAVLPLPWIASTCGWIVAEMGRQPWVVYGFLPTVAAVQLPTLAAGVFTTLLVTSAYILLACLFVLIFLRLIRRGPGAPLLSASWWRRLSGPDRLATA